MDYDKPAIEITWEMIHGAKQDKNWWASVEAQQQREAATIIDDIGQYDPIKPQELQTHAEIEHKVIVSRMSNFIAMSDDHVASEFAEAHKDILRFDHARGKWFLWNNTHWLSAEKGQGFHFAREFCAAIAPKAGTETMQRKLASVKCMKDIEFMSRSDPRVATTAEGWDADAFLLATPSGTVDLRTGDLREPRPDDMISKICAVGPSPDENCPIWKQFMKEACNDHEEQIEFLQKMAGYSLTGDTREHALFFIYGNGGNGKGVFMNVLTKIMHEYATTAPMETFTASKFGSGHPTDLASLAGARLVTASETEEGKKWAEARIKSITGGEPVTARFMRQDFFTFNPTFKLLIIGNHKPSLASVDAAAKRRFRLVPFENEPKVVDKQLEHRLVKEFPAILRWMINGCLKWQRDGVNPPEIIKEATDQYFSEQDTLQQWLDERCVVDLRGNKVETTLAFTDWSGFAKGMGEDIGNKKDLTQALAKKGIINKTGKIAGQSCRFYIGIDLVHGSKSTQ